MTVAYHRFLTLLCYPTVMRHFVFITVLVLGLSSNAIAQDEFLPDVSVESSQGVIVPRFTAVSVIKGESPNCEPPMS